MIEALTKINLDVEVVEFNICCYRERHYQLCNLVYFSVSGVSLAQDRGRLEAKIEVLGAELETQKKQNERDNDALKIKAKIIDDQTETIRRLKEVGQYLAY